MHLLRVLSLRSYALLALGSGLAMAGAIPFIQNVWQLNNLDVWFAVLLGSPVNLVLYLAFSVLFGASVAITVYNRMHRTCGIGRSAPGAAGASLAFVLGVCPGCASLATLLFPAVAGAAGAAAALTVNVYATWFFLLSTALVLLSIALNRGFSREVPGLPGVPGPAQEIKG